MNIELSSVYSIGTNAYRTVIMHDVNSVVFKIQYTSVNQMLIHFYIFQTKSFPAWTYLGYPSDSLL